MNKFHIIVCVLLGVNADFLASQQYNLASQSFIIDAEFIKPGSPAAESLARDIQRAYGKGISNPCVTSLIHGCVSSSDSCEKSVNLGAALRSPKTQAGYPGQSFPDNGSKCSRFVWTTKAATSPLEDFRMSNVPKPKSQQPKN